MSAIKSFYPPISLWVIRRSSQLFHGEQAPDFLHEVASELRFLVREDFLKYSDPGKDTDKSLCNCVRGYILEELPLDTGWRSRLR